MIVCHCQQISDRDIDAAIDWMRASDETMIVTPGRIYRALGKRAVCGGCMTLFLSTMRSNPNMEVPMHLRNLRDDRINEERSNEGRRESHRVSESRSAE